jgi:hypothetical protein
MGASPNNTSCSQPKVSPAMTPMAPNNHQRRGPVSKPTSPPRPGSEFNVPLSVPFVLLQQLIIVPHFYLSCWLLISTAYAVNSLAVEHF